MKRKIVVALILAVMLSTAVSASFWDTLVESMMETIIPWIVKLMLYPLMIASFWMLKGVLYFNPTVFCYGQSGCAVTPGLDSLYPYVMNILVPVYVIALMFVALFFIMKSGSPSGRARARKMFFRLIMGMLMVIYAPFIYQAMLDISSRITAFYLEQVSINKLMALTSFGKAVAMCYLQCCMFIVVFITIIVLLVRWFYVYIYALFFPFILFLYFFEITKPYGSKYLKNAIKWIFVPPLQALILYVMVMGPLQSLGSLSIGGTLPVALQGLFTQVVGVFVVLAGMITMCAAPMIMTQILTFVGTAISSFGLAINSLPLMSVGNVMAGQGPGGFASAHGHFSRVRAYDSFQAGLGGTLMSGGAPTGMRMMGGERGAVEGRAGGGEGGGYEGYGGGEGGGYAPAGGGGEIGGAAESAIEARAAQRRGMPTMPSLGAELGKVRKKLEEKTTYEKEEESLEEKGGVEEKPTEKARRERTQLPGILPKPGTDAAAASPFGRDSLSEEREADGVDLSPETLRREREETTGKESPYDLLKSSLGGGASMGAGAAGPRARPSASGVDEALDTLAQAGAAAEDLAPLRDKGIYQETTLMKKPDEVTEGDTRVKRDASERKKALEEQIRIANEKLSLMQKQHGEKEGVQRAIAHLQQMLKTQKETEGNKLAPKKSKK